MNKEAKFNTVIEIFRKEKNFYVKYKGEIHKLDNDCLISIKNNIILPMKIKCIGIYDAQLKKIVNMFNDIENGIKLLKIKRNGHAFDYEVAIYQKKKTISAYKITNEKQLYLSNDIIPYFIVKKDKYVLMLPVTKNFVRKCSGIFVYLEKDINENNNLFNEEDKINIKYDFLYQPNPDDKSINLILK